MIRSLTGKLLAVKRYPGQTPARPAIALLAIGEGRVVDIELGDSLADSITPLVGEVATLHVVEQLRADLQGKCVYPHLVGFADDDARDTFLYGAVAEDPAARALAADMATAIEALGTMGVKKVEAALLVERAAKSGKTGVEGLITAALAARK